MKSKQILSIEQMKKLREIGLDLKDTMLYWCRAGSGQWTLRKGNKPMLVETVGWEYIPAYTLQDVLDALPRFVTNQNRTYDLLINMEQYVMEYFRESDIDTLVGVKFENTSLIDAAYSMLCWCIENGHVNTKN